MTFTTGHVGLNVANIDRSVDFYCDVFGWKVLEEGGNGDQRFAFLGESDDLLVTLWQQANQRFDTARAGLHHLAFEVKTVAEVQEAEARVRKHETRLYHDGVVRHDERGASGGIFFEDPDGTRLEIYAESGVDDAPVPSGAAPACGFF